jgi:hypothetical protein
MFTFTRNLRWLTTLTEKEAVQSSREQLESISSYISKLQKQSQFSTLQGELARLKRELPVYFH